MNTLGNHGLSPFAILLGGSLAVTPRLRGQLSAARVIAADSGMRHAAALDVVPECWVGDFDSADADLQHLYASVPRHPFPVDKDATDGELAVEMAIGLGAGRLILAGALAGERSDHALQHLFFAVALARRGHPVLLTSGLEEAVPLLAGQHRLDLPVGSLFSILPLSPLAGLSIQGARYGLEPSPIAFGSSRTLSNQVESEVTLSLDAGEALILARPHLRIAGD